VPVSLKALVSGEKTAELVELRQLDPEYAQWKHAGLIERFHDSPELAAREETYMSKLGEKIPVVGQLARAGNRSMTEHGNWLRQNTANKMWSRLKPVERTMERRQMIAKLVNGMTGQGNLGMLEKYTPQLAMWLYSPRYKLGRAQHVYWSAETMFKDPVLRKQVARQWVQATGSVVGILAAAKAAGADVDTDLESSDWGKIKVGNTRWDITGGMVSPLRTILKVALGRSKDPVGELGRQASYQLSPLASEIGWTRGMYKPGREAFNKLSNKERLTAVLRDNSLPFTVNDIWDAVETEGWGRAASVGPTAYLGIGAQSYKDTPRKDVRAY
jgi:hypothetical protein